MENKKSDHNSNLYQMQFTCPMIAQIGLTLLLGGGNHLINLSQWERAIYRDHSYRSDQIDVQRFRFTSVYRPREQPYVSGEYVTIFD